MGTERSVNAVAHSLPFLSLERCRRFVSFKDLKMCYVAAYLLAVLGGNASPSSKDIKNILGSVGIEADDERLDKVISELNGKDVNEVMNAAEEKKEEKKEESEESDEDMGFGLFD
ncbi:hypothetical protein JZ751_003432 [Albula glossodonta]|uniref:Large ribosomal subunit protein P2 n=1 Tax=Albula glossodonta TaxID=121402 RepID=A0A8T2N6M7_9TELE|nr:hypothetical protein JZ751_003432 [Albula glossodonta]